MKTEIEFLEEIIGETEMISDYSPDTIVESIYQMCNIRYGELVESNDGYKKDLHLWFGLSYASFLVLPRVLMQEMPKEWKEKIALLLNEYDEMYPNQPDISTRVQATKDGKMVEMPKWLINYRRPNLDAIEQCKKEADNG